jgi:hypothetical protein
MEDIYIYEAGCLTFLNQINNMELATSWREKLDSWASDYDIMTFNPAKNFTNQICHSYSNKLIVEQNEFFLNKCNIMVVLVQELYLNWLYSEAWESQ